MKALEYCANGDGNPVCPPSKVICKACMDAIRATLVDLVERKAMTPPPVSVLTKEEWRAVVGYEGRYEVSSEGRVRSLVVPRWHTPRAEPLVMRLSVQKSNGYLAVTLWPRRFTVHVLVLRAFVGPPPNGHEAAHANGIKTDARLSNLSYKTRRANHADKRAHGTSSTGVRNPQAKANDVMVREIRALAQSGTKQCAIATKVGLSARAVADIVYGRSWTHVQ